MNVGKAPLLIAVFVAVLFLAWEFLLAPMLGVTPHPPRQELQQGTSRR